MASARRSFVRVLALALVGSWCCFRLPMRTAVVAAAGLAAVAAAAIALTWRHARWLPPASLSEEHVRIAVDGVEQPLRAVQLSDLHWRVRMDPVAARIVEDAVQRANAARPDLIFLTGDLIDLDPAAAASLAPVLGQLRARLGVFAILGNHDMFRGQPEVVVAALEGVGIEVLRNRSVFLSAARLGWSAGGLHVVGLGDLSSGDCRTAPLLDLPPHGPRIVLAHNPDTVAQLQGLPARVDVVLSGHTHGGQICLPSAVSPTAAADPSRTALATGSRRGFPLLRMLRAVHGTLPRPLRWLVPGRRHLHVVRNWQWAQGLHVVERADERAARWPPIALYVSRGLADPYRRAFCDPEVSFLTFVPRGER